MTGEPPQRKFPDGNVLINHKPDGPATETFDPTTCYFTFTEKGTWKTTGGSGAYTAVQGSGTYKSVVEGFGCEENEAPDVFYLKITAKGDLATDARVSAKRRRTDGLNIATPRLNGCLQRRTGAAPVHSCRDPLGHADTRTIATSLRALLGGRYWRHTEGRLGGGGVDRHEQLKRFTVCKLPATSG